MKFIDAHTHVQFAAFRDDWRETMARALNAGVFVVNVGTQKDTSRRAVEIAREYPEGVWAAVGLHPLHTSKSFHDAEELGGREGEEFTSRGEEFDRSHYLELARDPKTVAIGECGMDYFHLPDAEGAKAKQKAAFEAQMELAKEVGKPLMVHCRPDPTGTPTVPSGDASGDAYRETIDMLKASDPGPGIIHSFMGTLEEAEEFLELGYYFTFAGNITFKPRADKPSLEPVIRHIPLDRIISETDAPYLAPVPHRGKRNEPLYVIEVVKKLAEIKGMSAEEMAELTFNNAKMILGT